MRDGAGMQYIYTAVFTKDADGSLIANFPDIPGCTAKGANMLEAVQKAGSVLSLCLFDMEQQGVAIPKARYPDEIVTNEGEIASVIVADTYKYHLRFGNKTVESEISLPAWLGDAAKASKLDLSQIFQDAVKREMGMPVFKGNKKPASAKPIELFFGEDMETAPHNPNTPPQPAPPKPQEPEEEFEEELVEFPEVSPYESPEIPQEKPIKREKSNRRAKRQAAQEKVKEKTKELAIEEPPVVHKPIIPTETRPKRDTKPLAEARRQKEIRKPKVEDDLSIANKIAIAIMYCFIFATVIVVIIAALLVFTDVLDDIPAFGSRPLVGSVMGSEVTADTHEEEALVPVTPEIDMLRRRLNNDDIVGIITIGGTNIDSAIVQGEDDDFYRTHNRRKEPSRYGSIFLSSLADVRNLSRNTVLFGRKIPQGGMFYDIGLFADSRFFSQPREIRFTTNYGIYHWEAFSFYSDISEHDFNTVDNENWGVQVQTYANRSIHPSNVTVGEDDIILTLIAECADGGKVRYILHARLIS